MTLNVACVLKIEPDNYKRPIYNKSWVDKLYRAVKRNYGKDFNFVCLTNDIDSCKDYDVEPLSFDSWGWWNKLDLFSPDLFNGPTLFLDLDVVICKDFTQEIENLPDNILLMCVEPYKNLLNSSVMYWNGDFTDLYFDFLKNQHSVISKYQYPTDEQPAIGDGAFIVDHLNNRAEPMDKYVSKGFFSWKHHKVQTPMNNPAMLIFTSTEKPTNNTDLDLVKNNWI